MLKGKRIFISGGNGVIGKELVTKLYNNKATVFVGDLKPRPSDLQKDIIYRQGDLNYIVKEELESFRPDFFFHLAATFERSVETYDFWYENFLHNVKLSYHLMSILKDIPSLKRVIFASSYLIYDPSLYSFDKPQKNSYRLKETDPIYPRNLTGMAKLMHEIELRFLGDFKCDDFSSVSARIFRSYGKHSRDVISRWIMSLLKGETLSVFRKEGMFDYIYAGEVAEGLIKLAENGNARGIYNLGNDNSRSIKEVLDILKCYFPEMQIDEIGTDIDFEASQANMDKFFKDLGWKPEKELEDVIPVLIDHVRKGIVDENRESKP